MVHLTYILLVPALSRRGLSSHLGSPCDGYRLRCELRLWRDVQRDRLDGSQPARVPRDCPCTRRLSRGRRERSRRRGWMVYFHASRVRTRWIACRYEPPVPAVCGVPHGAGRSWGSRRHCEGSRVVPCRPNSLVRDSLPNTHTDSLRPVSHALIIGSFLAQSPIGHPSQTRAVQVITLQQGSQPPLSFSLADRGYFQYLQPDVSTAGETLIRPSHSPLLGSPPHPQSI